MAPATSFDLVEERSVAQLAVEMTAGRTTSEQITTAYLARIDRLDRSGPTLRSVLSVNPNALADARALDAERRAGRVRGPAPRRAHPAEGQYREPRTADHRGSLALAANATGRDAPIAAGCAPRAR
jgi:amidase